MPVWAINLQAAFPSWERVLVKDIDEELDYFMNHKVLIMKELNPFMLDQYEQITLKSFEIVLWDIKSIYKDYNKIDSNFLANRQLTDLWKSNDDNYSNFLQKFLDLAKNIDIIYFNIFCPFPPEWVYLNLKKSVNIYFCNDDPHKSYERSAGAVWAFDLVTHWSPTYDKNFKMQEILSVWGAKRTMLMPLSFFPMDDDHIASILSSLNNDVRTNDALYIGGYYRLKYRALVYLKRTLNDKLIIAGNWPLFGLIGFLGFLKGRPNLNYKVSKLSISEKANLHLKSKIVVNMHLSENMEHGNFRTFESIFYGNLLITDRGILREGDYFFKPDAEAVYYNNVEEIPSLVEYYSLNSEKRFSIVKAAMLRFKKDYNLETLLGNLFNEAIKILKQKHE